MGTSRGSSHHIFSMPGRAPSTPRSTGRGEPSDAPTLPPRRSCRGQTTGAAPLATGGAALPTCFAAWAPGELCGEGAAAAGVPHRGRSTRPALAPAPASSTPAASSASASQSFLPLQSATSVRHGAHCFPSPRLPRRTPSGV